MRDVLVKGSNSTHGIRVYDIIAIFVVCSRTDGVRTAHVGRDRSQNRKSRGRGTTEPVGSKSLVAENRGHTVRTELLRGAIGEELEDERDFRESCEYATNVELKLEKDFI
jgi:hypothetical protein